MPSTAAASAREILTGLNAIMAKRTNAQAKLNKVVELIGEAMGSEVCSIYLLRDGVFSQITKDHSFVQQLLDEGRITADEALHHPQRSLVTRVLTGRPEDQRQTPCS